MSGLGLENCSITLKEGKLIMVRNIARLVGTLSLVEFMRKVKTLISYLICERRRRPRL